MKQTRSGPAHDASMRPLIQLGVDRISVQLPVVAGDKPVGAAVPIGTAHSFWVGCHWAVLSQGSKFHANKSSHHLTY